MMRDQERLPKGKGAWVKSEVQVWIGQNRFGCGVVVMSEIHKASMPS